MLVESPFSWSCNSVQFASQMHSIRAMTLLPSDYKRKMAYNNKKWFNILWWEKISMDWNAIRTLLITICQVWPMKVIFSNTRIGKVREIISDTFIQWTQYIVSKTLTVVITIITRIMSEYILLLRILYLVKALNTIHRFTKTTEELTVDKLTLVDWWELLKITNNRNNTIHHFQTEMNIYNKWEHQRIQIVAPTEN